MKRWLVLGFVIAACRGDDADPPIQGGSGDVKAVAPVVRPAVLVGCAAAGPPPRSRLGGSFGGGTGWGTIGAGRLGTIGGTGSGYGGLLGRGPVSPRASIGTPTTIGDLDKAIIRRYVRRNLSKITYCYEKELLAKPALAGTLSTEFTIDANGHVRPDVKATGVDPAVASCIASVIAAIEFPKPKGGGIVVVRYPFTFRLAGDPGLPPAPPPRPSPDPLDPALARQQAIQQARAAGILGEIAEPSVREWTPFATSRSAASRDDVAPAAAAVVAAIIGKVAEIDRCFDGGRGSLRAMIAVGLGGKVGGVRAGGIGDRAIERCVETALAGLRVDGLLEPIEIACDFARGGAGAPWRVTPDGGYAVIQVTATELRHDHQSYPVPTDTQHLPRLAAQPTYLVIAEPDVPGATLQLALDWASGGAATLVAVKASGGAPVFLGMGPNRRGGEPDGDHVELRTRGGKLDACASGTALPDAAPILDPRAMDRVIAAVKQRCPACSGSVSVGLDAATVAKDLVATTSAARRAGLHDLVIGDPVCAP